ncbi:MAG TPA: CDP-alcohol phosphatidyltransferase family protein [Bacteroidia bacterium]|jgi:cardiolipin synthase|nr:CDP-alcohol phosphatidyltransferase family protein [Bacteroidia bacterium]
MKKKLAWIPNMLSVYRMLALPFILRAILAGDPGNFILLLSINLISDILDGFIARRFHFETELGARLDSFADMGTYSMAFTGMLVLQHSFVQAHYVAFIAMMILYTLPQLVCLARFHRPTSLHLYSSKVLGYVQGVFIVHLFLTGGNEFFFWFMTVQSYCTYLEALLIVLFIPVLRSNVKGVFFMIRDYKKIS